MFHKIIADKLNELGWNRHTLAEKSNLPYDTVKRIVSGKTLNPTIDTLDRIANAMGCSILDFLTDTRTVVGSKTMAELQDEIDTLKTTSEMIVAERDLLLAKNAILEEKVSTLSSENDLLKMEIRHKEELLAVHNYYIRQNEQR